MYHDVFVDGSEVTLAVLFDGAFLSEEGAELFEEVLGELRLLHVIRVQISTKFMKIDARDKMQTKDHEDKQ